MSTFIRQLQHWFAKPTHRRFGTPFESVTAAPLRSTTQAVTPFTTAPFTTASLPSSLSTAESLAVLNSNGVQLTLPELLHYQRHTPWYDLTPRQVAQNKLAGSYLSRIKGRGMEFDEVRHYQNGDDVRSIDWRVTARTGKVHTKLFREERERPVFIVTDVGPSMQFGSQLLFKSVQAAHVAALAAFAVLERGDKLGGVIVGDRVRDYKPASRSPAVLRYINGLVELNNQCLASITDVVASPPSQSAPSPQAAPEAAASHADINTALAQLRQLCRPGSLLLIISDFSALDPQGWAHLEMLTRHNDVKFTHIVDPLELALPQQSDAEIVIDAAVTAPFALDDFAKTNPAGVGESMSASLADPRLQQQYQQQQAAWLHHIEQQCRRLGIKRQIISAGAPLLPQLRDADIASQGGQHVR